MHQLEAIRAQRAAEEQEMLQARLNSLQHECHVMRSLVDRLEKNKKGVTFAPRRRGRPREAKNGKKNYGTANTFDNSTAEGAGVAGVAGEAPKTSGRSSKRGRPKKAEAEAKLAAKKKAAASRKRRQFSESLAQAVAVSQTILFCLFTQ